MFPRATEVGLGLLRGKLPLDHLIVIPSPPATSRRFFILCYAKYPINSIIKKTQKSGNNSEKETKTNKRPKRTYVCNSVALGKKVK